MDRLTDRDDLNQAVVHPQYCGDDISWEDYIGLLLDRLAAYEDTGLTPEDLKEVQDALGKTPMNRFYDIMQAEREGRLVVLPCKVGNTVYSTSENECKESEIMCFSIEEEGVYPVLEYDLTCHTVGIDVFLTREEAETALKEAGKSDRRRNEGD
jgi:hypothetical protein